MDYRLEGRACVWRNSLAVAVCGLSLGLAAWAGGAMGMFEVVPSPSPNRYGNVITAVDMAAPNDIWAVGFRNSSNVNESRTLTQHWNGTSWTTVRSPNPGTPITCLPYNSGNWLAAVAVESPNDVWAVGYQFSCTTLIKPLVLHWNGRRWSEVATPALNPEDNSALLGIVARAPDDIYAVGYHPAENLAVLTLVEHWNGEEWSVVPSPNLSPTGCILSGIAAAPNGELWAVGDSVDADTTSIQTLVLHSVDGMNWEIVPSPNPLPPDFLQQNVLVAVTAPAPDDVTAVGYLLDFDHQRTLTLIEHWDGEEWSVVPSPNWNVNAGALNKLTSVSALATDNLYAVGFNNSGAGGNFQTMIQHFDGEGWSIINSPVPGLSQQLWGVKAHPGSGAVWAGGAWSQYATNLEFGLLQFPQTLSLVNMDAGSASRIAPPVAASKTGRRR